MDNILRGVVVLSLHLHRLLLLVGHLHTQDAEVGSPQIQSYEVPLFCQTREHNTPFY